MLALISGTAALYLQAAAGAQETAPEQQIEEPVPTDTTGAVETAPEPPMYIREYRVQGARNLPRISVEEAVYPYLGPGRTSEDVEQARAALEKAYHEKGFETVSVEIPVQQVRRGIVRLQVVEATVGRFRVKGSRYFLPSHIKNRARSMAEGRVINFNQVTQEIVGLNQLADRQITPEIRAGVELGTVDIDLNVKDTFPLHGSVELNNRYTANTTPLRLSAALSYNNLWQLGHSIGGNFQISPQNPDEVRIYSGYYIARFPNYTPLSLMLTATKQESNTVIPGSGAGVTAPGEVIGLRALIALPPGKGFSQSLSVDFDYKHFEQTLTLAGLASSTPISYYPFTLGYSANWQGKGYNTAANAGITWHFRGMGSKRDAYDENRFRSDGNFVYFRGDIAHTQKLPEDFEVFGKVLGQIANRPLLNTEQIAGGGLDSVRGYLEAEALADNGLFGSLEVRTPSLLSWMKGEGNEWRFYTFLEGGILILNDPLPEQEDRFELASYGFGTRFQMFDYLNASLDAGFPIVDGANTKTGDLRLTFRVWAEF
ncbi:MAG TPA: POTRA domain-containing protein [Chthoniobacteraceae bacterium]|jgi:hemolysin activation/secretion protein